MRIAIPIAAGKLAMHFGHCEQFAIIDVDPGKKESGETQFLAAPAHQPGLLPAWLAQQDVNLVIAGGMGQRAHNLFSQQNIQVVVGAAAVEPEILVREFLDGTLAVGENICDH